MGFVNSTPPTRAAIAIQSKQSQQDRDRESEIAIASTLLQSLKFSQDWQYSSIHRFIALGIYPTDWGRDGRQEKPQGFWDD